MKTKAGSFTTALLLLAVSASGAQNIPSSSCVFDGFSGDFILAKVATSHPVTGYFGCAKGKDCLSTSLPPGTPVEVYRVKGDWTCGYSSDSKGAAPKWIKSTNLRPVRFDSNPPLKAWTGTWKGGEDRVVIRLAREPGALHLSGHADWEGAHDVVHYGDFAGEAIPKGNRLRFVEDDSNSYSCTVDLTLFDSYLIAEDNGHCGGMNVRFSGIWRRMSQSHR